MSRGPGHVMLAIEAHLATLPEPRWFSYDELPEWLDYDERREAGCVPYDELASIVYGVREPSRAQPSATARAVERLVEPGKAQRWLTGYQTEATWSQPVPGKGRRRGQEGVRRGFVVQRGTLVTRGPRLGRSPR